MHWCLLITEYHLLSTYSIYNLVSYTLCHNNFFYVSTSLHPATTDYTHQHKRLICPHTIDYVTIDVHTKKNHIYSFSQALGDTLKMVPA